MELSTPTVIVRPRLEGIEALRALAAFLVVAYHLVLLTDMKVPAYLDIIEKFFGQGVPLFYVLSGFVLSYGYLDRLEDRQQTLRFWINRYFRIAPLFYAMIIANLIYAKYKTGLVSITAHEIVLNLSLLFGLVPQMHESVVAAGWSIGVEVLFYLMFPIITIVIRNVSIALLALMLAIFIGSTSFVASINTEVGRYAYMNIITHLPFFIAGTATFLVWKKFDFVRSKVWGSVLLLGTVAAVAAFVYVPQVAISVAKVQGVQAAMYIWTLFFSALVLAICLCPLRVFVNKTTNYLGGMSFSLYLWHPIVIFSLSGFYKQIQTRNDQSLLGFGLCLATTLAILVVVAHASYRLIECPGIRLGRRIANAS